jgi:hypothetical protein
MGLKAKKLLCEKFFCFKKAVMAGFESASTTIRGGKKPP